MHRICFKLTIQSKILVSIKKIAWRYPKLTCYITEYFIWEIDSYDFIHTYVHTHLCCIKKIAYYISCIKTMLL